MNYPFYQRKWERNFCIWTHLDFLTYVLSTWAAAYLEIRENNIVTSAKLFTFVYFTEQSYCLCKSKSGMHNTMYGRKFQPANKSFRLIRSEKMQADYIYQVSSKTFYIMKQQLRNLWKIQWELFLEWENFKITSMEFFAVWVLCVAQKWEDNQFNQSYCKTSRMHWQRDLDAFSKSWSGLNGR